MQYLIVNKFYIAVVYIRIHRGNITSSVKANYCTKGKKQFWQCESIWVCSNIGPIVFV